MKLLEEVQLGAQRIVVTDYGAGDADNVYALDADGKLLWRIAPRPPGEPNDPYVGVSVQDGRLVVIDFYGRRYELDPAAGRRLGRCRHGREW